MTLTAEQTLARSMSEDELLRVVLDLLELHGWHCYHVRNSRAGTVQGNGAIGFPDVIAIKGGRTLVAELKREGKHSTVPQELWLRDFRDAGAESYQWWPSHYLSGRIGAVLGSTGR